DEIIRSDFPGVDSGKHDRVRDDRPKRLHDIEGERRSPVARRMTKTAIGIESNGGERDRQMARQHRICERQHRIHWICWWSAIAGVEPKRSQFGALVLLAAGWLDETREGPEISRRRIALNAEQRRDRGHTID